MTATDWTSGYVADVNYTFGYYSELNPLRAHLALLNQGYAPPKIETACELGFGQGMSVAMHAAATNVEWWGTDFNPAQAAFARDLAMVSGASAKLFDEAFADFVDRDDLPDFDFIGLHGIWSWVSDANRAALLDLIRRKLRPGGLLYISYNTQPGWASFVPMRHLLTELASSAAGESTTARVEQALDFADKLLLVDPIFVRANPQVAERLKKMREQDRQYLAHEYFNRDWRPMHFSEAAELLSAAKLSFVGSAHYLDHVDALNLSPAQVALVAELKNGLLREQVRDFVVNQQFRRDYWIKGPQRLSGLEQAERLQNERIVLATPREKVSLKVAGALGEGALSEAIYQPILDTLADHKPRSLAELAASVEKLGVTFAHVVEAAVVLSNNMQMSAAQDAAAVKAAKPRTDRLNAFLEARARSHADAGYLASPLTGGGVGIGRFDQLFLSSVKAGAKTPADWAQYVWSLLAAQNQKIVKEGAPLQTPEENLAELGEQAKVFGETVLPLMRALAIA